MVIVALFAGLTGWVTEPDPSRAEFPGLTMTARSTRPQQGPGVVDNQRAPRPRCAEGCGQELK